MMTLRNLMIGLTVCLAAVLMVNMTFIGTAVAFLRDGRMAYGLTVGSVPIGGMTREEAEAAVGNSASKPLAGEALVLSLSSEGKVFSFTAGEIGLSADAEAILDKAYQVGRDGSLPQRAADMLDCAINGREVGTVVTLNEEKLKAALAEVAKAVARPPHNAEVVFSSSGISHQDSVKGRKLDSVALAEKVKPRLLGLHLPCREELSPDEEEPEVRLEDIRDINGFLSGCSTYYIADTGRGDNIEIAAAALDGCIILPGKELSFNERVGRRVASKGYSDAPVIVDGKVEQDIGGGVCQVSSTLYNAILMAGMTPTARTAHFYPSAYVDPGLDATVADGQIDFVFMNSLPHSVVLRAGGSGGTLTVEVYGCTGDLAGDIELETVIIGPPPTVEVYRVTYSGDKVLSREYLHTDEYDVPPPPEEKKPETASAPAPEPDPEPEPEPESGPAPEQRQEPTPTPVPASVPAGAGEKPQSGTGVPAPAKPEPKR